MTSVLDEVRRRIDGRALGLRDAAVEIGVTESSLRRHLEGDYVRSDSLAKYRRWLGGEPAVARKRRSNDLVDDDLRLPLTEHSDDQPRLWDGPVPRHAPFRVVDTFSGCGGLSLGFDLFGAEAVFSTVLALDIEEAMVQAYNDNHSLAAGRGRTVCRKVDIVDFLNEAEVLAFYLDHLASVSDDGLLRQGLARVTPASMEDFKAAISLGDKAFTDHLTDLKRCDLYRQAFAKLATKSLGQTSVIGFHAALKLPMTSARVVDLGPLVWGDSQRFRHSGSDLPLAPKDLVHDVRGQLELSWKREVDALRARVDGKGRGQLASSAKRIFAFIRFIESPAVEQLRELWLDWRSKRDALRFMMFSGQHTFETLQSLYQQDRRVTVVLGGPPCQGFSRIGRGKIRSLRENAVHVHYDQEAGDIRNHLLHKYVLFVSALQPDAFLFENVRHFQATVKTAEGTFHAPEVLAEAIRSIAQNHLSYRVATRTIAAAEHSIPQARERFFMVGVRDDIAAAVPLKDPAKWCLSLSRREEVPLRVALEGLPEAITTQGLGADLSQCIRVTNEAPGGDDSASFYRRWVLQTQPQWLSDAVGEQVDAHWARSPRRDDAAFFSLLGPGTRWLDYRCDDSSTLKDLTSLLERLDKMKPAKLRELLPTVDRERLHDLLRRVNGSLAIRLLLESITPHSGELEHHLLAPGYLEKTDGNHGDWLSRLDPDRPSKTIVTHMGKDTYAYVHPWRARTLSVREAARIQTFPDWFRFRTLGLVDAFRVIGNAVPPLLSHQLASRVAQVLWISLLPTKVDRVETFPAGSLAVV